MSSIPPPPPPPPAAGRTGMLTAAGVLLIIGSVFALIGGLYWLYGGWYDYVTGESEYFYELAYLTAVGVFEIIGFAFGLTAGIQSLRRKKFSICIAGAVLLLVAGAVHFSYFAFVYASLERLGLNYILSGMSIVIPAVWGLVFVALRKRDFR